METNFDVDVFRCTAIKYAIFLFPVHSAKRNYILPTVNIPTNFQVDTVRYRVMTLLLLKPMTFQPWPLSWCIDLGYLLSMYLSFDIWSTRSYQIFESYYCPCSSYEGFKLTVLDACDVPRDAKYHK